ncbi:unannotated protein [freshwater metagenome]|uniref:Unannotated protein n=1 Tax=freshwater metagenome TaxID=449393 RepID=A0A6J7J8W0_9ZZZZ|nr:hypothetical protein [Actinomycetota bacterium]
MDPDAYDDFLAPLPDARATAVKAWLGSTLKACPVCDQPIHVMDSHRLTKTGLHHTACVPQDD